MQPAECDEILRYVRRAAESILAGRSPAPAPTCAVRAACGGAFVTFRRGEALRGCMGRFTSGEPLSAVLADVVASAVADPRFTDVPVTLAELPLLHIEVSILGELTPVADWRQVEVGRHGVVITCAGRRGCFLPQVAVERGWTLEVFLAECCRQKLGVAADAWRSAETRISAFETTILSEPEPPVGGYQPGGA